MYLIENSRSASITGLVTSIVLAEPGKLFNVAKVLFRTKELFFFETGRLQLEMSAKSLFGITLIGPVSSPMNACAHAMTNIEKRP